MWKTTLRVAERFLQIEYMYVLTKENRVFDVSPPQDQNAKTFGGRKIWEIYEKEDGQGSEEYYEKARSLPLMR